MISDNKEKEWRKVIQVQQRKGARRNDLEDTKEDITLQGRGGAGRLAGVGAALSPPDLQGKVQGG